MRVCVCVYVCVWRSSRLGLVRKSGQVWIFGCRTDWMTGHNHAEQSAFSSSGGPLRLTKANQSLSTADVGLNCDHASCLSGTFIRASA